MLLSKLVFLCVKNVIYLNDTSFNYYGFVKGDFNNDIDYDININNVFSPLNEAISRLSDLERIPYVVEQVQTGKIIDLSTLTREVKEVINVAQVHSDGSYHKLHHVMFGRDKVRIVSPINCHDPIYVEYKENIKEFDKTDIVPIVEDPLEGDLDLNIDLYKEYGINNTIANYIIEYVQGKLLEPIAPELANMHITRAEAYFANIAVAKTSFPQLVNATKYVIGE